MVDVALDDFPTVTTTSTWQMSLLAFSVGSSAEPSSAHVVACGPDAAYAGTVAAISESLRTWYFADRAPPKVTAVAPVKPVPKMSTVPPPVSGPAKVPTLVTAGTADPPFSSTYSKSLATVGRLVAPSVRVTNTW